jgi:hypothetical protein
MLNFTPLMRRWASWRAAKLERQDNAAVQERQLLSLVARARSTAFGRDHDFNHARSVADFQARVPLRRFEDFWESYWRDPFPRLKNVTWPGTIPYFAVTSGTTSGRTKYIPCSKEMIAANSLAGAELMGFHVRNRPDSRVLGGKSFMLGGSTDLTEQAPGVYSGDVSGIMAANVPRWFRRRMFPPRELALLSDWEEKVARLAESCAAEDIRLIGGTPSWLLVFFDVLAELRGVAPNLATLFPNLEILVHGGVDFSPYRRRFTDLLAGSHAELREVYPASEGFIAAADRGEGEGLRLNLSHGLFFEFVPVEELDSERPTRHWVADAEPGVNYALVLSTCAGLWGYVLGDTVELVACDPPRVKVTGRTSYMLSAFGEHLIATEVETAVSAAAAEIGASVSDWSVGPVFPEAAGELGGHLYVVEFAEAGISAAQLEAFAKRIDRELCATNEDYAAHRAEGFGMAAPQVRVVAPGSFAAWMKSRGQLGGQHKVPRIILDRELFANLQNFAASA